MAQNQFNIAIHEKINSGMCRLCLSSDGALIDMFSFSSELRSPIADAVMKCTSVHVQKRSELPKTICESCYMQLIKTQNFQLQALKSDRTLQLYFQQLQDGDKQIVLGSPAILPDIDRNSSHETKVANQDNEENSTNCKEIKPCVKYSENDFEMDNVEKKVFKLDSKSHTEWNVNSSSKDSIFNSNVIVKAEPIINENDKKDRCDIDTGSDFAETQRNIKLENEITSEKIVARYMCDVCTKCFSKTTTLRIHQRIHTGEKPYQCNVCNKSFRNSSNFRIHQSVHTGEKPYQCDVCNKSFSKLDHLRTHQRVHTGEKPYQCDICNKCFSHASTVRRHERVHTGEKGYQCDVCNKSFSKLDNLRTHQRVHSGEKPYQCNVCNKSFSKLDNLRTHQRVHTGEKPYQCDVCNKCFSQLSGLNSHKRKHLTDV